MGNKDNNQDFGKFNSLRNTLMNNRSNMSLSSCLLVKLTCAHTRSEHNKEDDDLPLLISPFITARKIAGIYWVIFSCFNSVYGQFYFHVATMII